TKTASFTVTNANPTGEISGAPGSSIAEGTAVDLTLEPADAGARDTLTYAWSVKKDNVVFTLPDNVSTTGTSFSFTPPDNGSYVATVRITDDDNGFVDVSTNAITVTNANPTADISGAPESSIAEGTAVNLSAD